MTLTFFKNKQFKNFHLDSVYKHAYDRTHRINLNNFVHRKIFQIIQIVEIENMYFICMDLTLH